MAASSKNVRLAKSFKERLDLLGCPYTEGVDASWILEPLFKPGEPRIRLLQWLFVKFDGRLDEILDPSYTPIESQKDSRIQRLLFVASTLGLCKYNDVDLIRGVTSTSKQAAFMDQLLDMVTIMDNADENQTMSFSPGIVTQSSSLNEQFTNACLYVDQLADQNQMHTMFKTRFSRLPPDLQKQAEVSWAKKGFTKDKPPDVDLSTLLEMANQVAKDVDRQMEILQDLKKNFKFQTEEENSQLDHSSRTLQIRLSDMSQLIVSFSYCYENEMRHWCNKTPPILTDLGVAFKRVYNLLQQFVALLNGLQQIRQSHANLDQDVKEKLGKSLTKDYQQQSIASQSTLDRLQHCISILEESKKWQAVDSSVSTETVKL
ncbi:uncharacterized protein LOC121369187 [Gigantopelta aegis]|uniref:uncharacterized protein LOC121369187 n=1 Tax=Gigantopelta aegis TaxID=1735272 RepID=UPI001B887AA6|nr:uncharacterized protein LOC121369187 [Gigantopelta aegis]